MTAFLFNRFTLAAAIIAAAMLIAGISLRRASRGCDPPETRAERYADPAPMPGEISYATEQQAARWQHCDWCDPAGTATSSAACTCGEPCEQPSGLWCPVANPALREASAEETEREIAGLLAGLDGDLS